MCWGTLKTTIQWIWENIELLTWHSQWSGLTPTFHPLRSDYFDFKVSRLLFSHIDSAWSYLIFIISPRENQSLWLYIIDMKNHTERGRRYWKISRTRILHRKQHYVQPQKQNNIKSHKNIQITGANNQFHTLTYLTCGKYAISCICNIWWRLYNIVKSYFWRMYRLRSYTI